MKIDARKLAVVAALVAFTTGVSGYFMARLQLARSTAPAAIVIAPPAATTDPTSAPLAPVYAALRTRTHHPNHAWRSALATLPPAPAFTAATPALSPAELTRLLATRTARRAYNGAPPTVPHPIDQTHSTSCLACHGTPTRIGSRDVPQMSHAPLSQCIQCHAPSGGPGGAAFTPVTLANTFTGLPPPASGTRAYTGAPPVMPHSTVMRQNCLSCHGPGGSSLIKTTHPERSSCLQCHATDSARETLPPVLGLIH